MQQELFEMREYEGRHLFNTSTLLYKVNTQQRDYSNLNRT